MIFTPDGHIQEFVGFCQHALHVCGADLNESTRRALSIGINVAAENVMLRHRYRDVLPAPFPHGDHVHSSMEREVFGQIVMVGMAIAAMGGPETVAADVQLCSLDDERNTVQSTMTVLAELGVLLERRLNAIDRIKKMQADRQ